MQRIETEPIAMKQRDNHHPEQRRDTIKSHLIEEHRHCETRHCASALP